MEYVRQNHNFQKGDGVIVPAHLVYGTQNECGVDCHSTGACLTLLRNTFCIFLCSMGRFYSIVHPKHFSLSWNMDNSKIWTTESHNSSWNSSRRVFHRLVVRKKSGPAVCNLQRTIWTSRMRFDNGLQYKHVQVL